MVASPSVMPAERAKQTPDEYATLIALGDHVEQANTQRMAYLVELARLRHRTLEALMRELGISAPSYV